MHQVTLRHKFLRNSKGTKTRKEHGAFLSLCLSLSLFLSLFLSRALSRQSALSFSSLLHCHSSLSILPLSRYLSVFYLCPPSLIPPLSPVFLLSPPSLSFISLLHLSLSLSPLLFFS